MLIFYYPLQSNAALGSGGNSFAINVTERLGLEDSGGMIRVGAMHYNTLIDVKLLKVALIKISVGENREGYTAE